MNEPEEFDPEELDELDPDVLMVMREHGIAMLTCNCQVPVTHWFNSRGEDCNPDDAVVCVCGDDEHGWFTLDLQLFDYVTVH